MLAASSSIVGRVERDATSFAVTRTPHDACVYRRSSKRCNSFPFCHKQYSSRPGPTLRSQAIRQDSTRTGAASISLTFTDVKIVDSYDEEEDSTADLVFNGQKTNSKPKILKINLDLALYRARSKQYGARRIRDRVERAAVLSEVETELRRCIGMDATDGRAYVMLGNMMVKHNRLEEAEQLYDQGSMATGGNNAHLWTAWANLASQKGDVSRARKLFDAATVADERHAAAWHGWGLMEKRQGNYLRARDLWSKGVQRTRSFPSPYLYQSLAVMAAELGRVEEARKWFDAGTRTPKGSSSEAMWQAWALMESQKGDPKIVRTLYKKGLEAEPRSRYIYLSWGMWEKSQGNTENARRLFKEGHKFNKRDPAILQAWAILEAGDGKVGLARDLMRKGAKADPSHVYIWQAWGVLEYQQGNLDTAREYFRRGVLSDPRSSDVALVFQAWAVLERSAGRYDEARELFKCAVKADPKSTPSWLAWAAMEESLEAYQRASELRNYNMQEHTELVLPQRLLDDPEAMQKGGVLDTLRSWFSSFEAGAVRTTRRTLPAMKEMGVVDGVQLTKELQTVTNKQKVVS